MVMATMGEAHREWHLNSGVPLGTPGCPQDACHTVEDLTPFTEMYPNSVKCGNKAAHVYGYDRETGEGYHLSADESRECFRRSGRFDGQAPPPPAPAVREGRQARGFHDARPDRSAIPVGEAGFGFYALPTPDGKNEVTSYRVQQLPSGKTFVRRFVSDDLFPVPDFARVLSAIAADPEAAGMLYAQHNVRCVRCNRKLTDDESKARGMGPVCAKKGWS